MSVWLKNVFSYESSDKKRAGECRKLFESKNLISYELEEIEERALALTKIVVLVKWESSNVVHTEHLEFGCSYQQEDGSVGYPWKDNGFGYLKIDYNINTGIGVDGEESLGENLRQHMEAVRNFIIKIKKEIPDIMIENCASGGCRLEPSMMDITGMSSASDTHDVYEGAIVAANLHYLTPPRQNQVWCTLRPQYDHNRFTHIISIGFLGRLCWSGDIAGLSKTQLDELFAAEKFYERVAPIIKHGNSYIYRTDICSFHSPTGTQAVVRYSEDGDEALVVIHTFEDMKNMKITLKGNYKIADSLYENTACIKGDVLEISNMSDFTGNVLLLSKK